MHVLAVELSRLDRTQGAQVGFVELIAQPDLMRHYVFMDVRASDVALFNTMKYYERLPADFISVITKYCDICRKHFTYIDCV